jgi:hypothetical protein
MVSSTFLTARNSISAEEVVSVIGMPDHHIFEGEDAYAFSEITFWTTRSTNGFYVQNGVGIHDGSPNTLEVRDLDMYFYAVLKTTRRGVIHPHIAYEFMHPESQALLKSDIVEIFSLKSSIRDNIQMNMFEVEDMAPCYRYWMCGDCEQTVALFGYSEDGTPELRRCGLCGNTNYIPNPDFKQRCRQYQRGSSLDFIDPYSSPRNSLGNSYDELRVWEIVIKQYHLHNFDMFIRHVMKSYSMVLPLDIVEVILDYVINDPLDRSLLMARCLKFGTPSMRYDLYNYAPHLETMNDERSWFRINQLYIRAVLEPFDGDGTIDPWRISDLWCARMEGLDGILDQPANPMQKARVLERNIPAELLESYGKVAGLGMKTLLNHIVDARDLDFEAKDIELIMSRAGVRRTTAMEALKKTDGDVINAILECNI